MTPQTVQLPPDCEYFVDCALEHGELDAGSLLAIKLYAPRRQVMDIIDGAGETDFTSSETIRRSRDLRLGMCAALTQLADEVIEDLPPDKRAMIAHAGIRHLHHRVRETGRHLAQWAIEDEIIGGCLKPWRRVVGASDLRRVEAYVPSPKAARRLHAPAWIRRYVKTNDEARALREVGSHALARLRAAGPDAPHDGADLIGDELAAAHEGYRRHNEEQLRRLRPHYLAASVTKIETRRRRQIIKKAASTAVSIMGRQPVADFANGRPVRLRGSAIDIQVQRAMTCDTTGHSGIHVSACEPTSGRKLADLCVYHEDTPALDQLTALHLSIAAGEEAEIVRTANIVRITDLGLKHPMLANRRPVVTEATWQPRDTRQRGNEAYWQATRPIWLDALGVYVLGRMWRGEAVA